MGLGVSGLTSQTHLAAPVGQGAIAKRHVAAAVVGNALEFYDFTTYAFFAAQIGRAFFPSHTPLDSLLLSLATFGAGFVTRPFGALVIGAIGDRAGRRPAMIISFTLMGVAIVALALCPSYAQIGPLAPVLVVAIRLVQGFALGGEVGPTTAFLLEGAPVGRRGVYTAMQSVSQNLAALTAGIVGFTLASLLSGVDLERYGWRIALLLGAVMLPFGLIVRRTLPETLNAPETDPHPDEEPGLQLRVVLCIVAVLVGGTVATYTQSYLTTYASAVLHMKVKVAFGATIVYGVTGIACNLLGAVLSDRFGRRPVMIAPRILLVLAIYPAFALLVHDRNAGALALMTATMTALASTSGGAMMASITESLRKQNRSTVLAVVYAVTIAVVGGTTQLVVTWLISVTGDLFCPAYYYIGATLVSLAGMIAIRESAPVRRLRTASRDVPA